MKLYRLNKQVLCVHNPDKLLKGLTTNTLDATKNALTDIYGRIIVTFDQLKLSPTELLILIEAPFFEQMQTHLEKFLTLTRTKLEKTDYQVYYDLDGSYTTQQGELVIPQHRGKLVLTMHQIPSSNLISESEFTLFRLKNTIPLQGIDYTHDLLLNVSEEFVSFTKGCFLGQEVLARVHNLSKPPKKLVVRYQDQCSEDEKKSMTSKIINPTTGRVIGFIFVKNSDEPSE